MWGKKRNIARRNAFENYLLNHIKIKEASKERFFLVFPEGFRIISFAKSLLQELKVLAQNFAQRSTLSGLLGFEFQSHLE